MTGEAWAPTAILRGLEPVKDYVNIVSGTRLPVRGMNNPHVEGVVGILTGGNPVIHESYSGADGDWNYMTVPGPTIDEHVAATIEAASFRSLALAVTPLHGSTGPGTAVRYTSHRGPYVFNPPVFEPAEVFASLFGGGVPMIDDTPDPQALARASVLDVVLEDAHALETRLGAADRVRFEGHLDGIRDLENRLRSLPSGRIGAACALPATFDGSDSYRARASAMSDLIAMAFACDLTRVVSMEFSSPASHAHYPDVFDGPLLFNGEPTSFHEYEHNVGIDATVRTGLQYFVDVFGEFLGRLAAVPDGDGNLLDHSLVLGTSDVADGWRHGFDDYPLLVAGRAGGALRYPGVHARLAGDNAARVPFTCLKALGSEATSWGTDQLATDAVVSEILRG
jgi:hypothetical protein